MFANSFRATSHSSLSHFVSSQVKLTIYLRPRQYIHSNQLQLSGSYSILGKGSVSFGYQIKADPSFGSKNLIYFATDESEDTG